MTLDDDGGSALAVVTRAHLLAAGYPPEPAAFLCAYWSGPSPRHKTFRVANLHSLQSLVELLQPDRIGLSVDELTEDRYELLAALRAGTQPATLQ